MERPQTAEIDCTDFEELIAAHQEAIHRLVFRLLGWRDGVEDVVQDVFLAAWAALSRCPRRDAGAWLKRIAINKCRSRMRRDAVVARWMKWMRMIFSEETSPAATEGGLIADERDGLVRKAIGSLEAGYREVIVLHYLEQMSVDEIAAVTLQRRNTVEVRLHRARKKLESLLGELME